MGYLTDGAAEVSLGVVAVAMEAGVVLVQVELLQPGGQPVLVHAGWLDGGVAGGGAYRCLSLSVVALGELEGVWGSV